VFGAQNMANPHPHDIHTLLQIPSPDFQIEMIGKIAKVLQKG
jgi:hypothetical protein